MCGLPLRPVECVVFMLAGNVYSGRAVWVREDVPPSGDQVSPSDEEGGGTSDPVHGGGEIGQPERHRVQQLGVCWRG